MTVIDDGNSNQAVRAPPFQQRFAEWAGAPDLAMPPSALCEARLSLLDTLACLVAGRDEPQTCRALAGMRAAAASGPVRGAAGDGLSLSAAALVNGAAIHALDYDDYEVPGSTHPSASLFGALLALAEVRTVSLDDLLTAWLVGYEAICRVGEMLGYGHYMAGWHSTSTIGTLGAAAAAARLERLPASSFANALSLATSMAAGHKAQFGSDVKALHAGFAARAGLESALLAGAGIEAAANAFEASEGFLACYAAPTSPGLAACAERVFGELAIDAYPVLRKPWPSCAYTHRSLEAAQTLAGAADFQAANIVNGVIRVPEPFARVAGFTRPQTSAEARFSLHYCVARMLVEGRIGATSFSPQALGCERTRDLMQRLVVDAYPPAEDLSDMSAAQPDTVTLVFADGSERAHTVAAVRGGMRRPLSEADLLAKYIDCGAPPALADLVLRAKGDSVFRLSDALPRELQATL